MSGLRYRPDQHEGRGSRQERKHDEPDKRDVLGYFETRFGIEPSVFDGHVFYIGGRGRLYLGPCGDLDGLRVATTGLTIARADEGIKPTTNLLQCFGSFVTKNKISLDRPAAIEFIKGMDISLVHEDAGKATDGYVLLVYQGFPLGCGLLKNQVVKNMLPKAKRINLKYL